MSDEEHVIMISGSRDFPNLDYVKLMVRMIKESGAKKLLVGYNPKTRSPKGVDETAYNEAVKIGLEVQCYPAVWVVDNQVKKNAGMLRNLDMVNDSTRVMCFWHQESRGTAHAIVSAFRANKLFRIYGTTTESPEELLRRAYKVRNMKFPEPSTPPETPNE